MLFEHIMEGIVWAQSILLAGLSVHIGWLWSIVTSVSRWRSHGGLARTIKRQAKCTLDGRVKKKSTSVWKTKQSPPDPHENWLQGAGEGVCLLIHCKFWVWKSKSFVPLSRQRCCCRKLLSGIQRNQHITTPFALLWMLTTPGEFISTLGHGGFSQGKERMGSF